MVTNVAVACQGGGSHTAFTAGALTRLLPAVAADDDRRLVGISGTSGGAISALAAWYGLRTGGADDAVETLETVWDGLCAREPLDRFVNETTVNGSRVQTSGFPTLEVSPYVNPYTGLVRRRFRRVLESAVDFDALTDLAGPEAPQLVVGCVDVNGGRFETFVDGEITPEVMLATTAIPELFEAVEIDGHHHWDGLFSQNPPIQELTYTDPARKPHELWVVQINPQTRDDEPRSLTDIADRRNELSGNISLNQELRFIETINDWVDEGTLPEASFNHIDVGRIALREAFGVDSKLDRSPAFVHDLMERGVERADAFLEDPDRPAPPGMDTHVDHDGGH